MTPSSALSYNVSEVLIDHPATVRERVAREWAVFVERETVIPWVSLEPLQPNTAADAIEFDELCRVWAASEFVAAKCVNRLGLLQELVTSGDLLRAYGQSDYPQKLRQALQSVDDEPQLMRVLREFRTREMVRIAWRDIAGRSPLSETLRDISDLADNCIMQSLSLLERWAHQQWGVPRDENGEAQMLVVLAMGKLGAGELNFSSDVDLIFTYPQEGETDGQRELSNSAYFAWVGKQLIRVLEDVTADGFVFRVDMRLRPFGNSGPLAICFDAMEHYYLSHGREWERYAMVKARPLNGDTPATHALMAVLRPFVFRRYLDFGVYEALRDMKQRIEVEMKRKGMLNNIKLGAGGIREVEFIGQAFQLIRGGRERALQTRQIVSVLQILAGLDVLPAYVTAELTEAYTFLRLTENRLQQYNDQQTHILPANTDHQRCLALAMGYRDWAAFKIALDEHRQRVHEHFQQVFAAPQIGEGTANGETQQLLHLWRGDLGESQGVELLQTLGFSDAVTLRPKITGLRQSQLYRTLSARGKERLDLLMPLVIAAAARYGHAGQVMQRVLGLIQAVAKRSSYLSLLAEYPMALSQLVKLCAASSWIATNLSKHPLLLDELLDPRTLYRPPSRPQLEQDIDARLSAITEDDLEQQMDALRHFKQTNVLRVAAADIAEAVPLMVVSDHLTYIAEVVLQRVLRLAWEHMCRRHGLPERPAGGTGFAVIAYGKLGGIELSYGSDLDLVFIYDADPNGETRGEKPIANSVFYSRLGQRMIHILTAFTPAGELYEVDMRLRPSGESGLLVTHIDRYSDYQLNKAWTWEHQALVRTRAVAGEVPVIAAFNALREQVLQRPREGGKLREEVVSMRARMRAELDHSAPDQFDLKQGLGGIADIEFMVQYMVLGWAQVCPKLTVYSDNIRILESAVAYGLLSAEQGGMLMDIYRRLRSQVHRRALQEQDAVVDNTLFTEERRKVNEIWQYVMALAPPTP